MTISPLIEDFNDYAIGVISRLPIRDKTRSTYESAMRRHIAPVLADKSLHQVKRIDIQRVIEPLAPQIAATTLAVMKSVFREAIANSSLEVSPAHGVSGHKVIVAPRQFLTWEEISQTNFGRYSTHIRFMALHGLRWGEAVALESSDIRDGRIHITKSVHGPTKTKAGIRTVPLIGEFVQIPRSPKTLRKVLNPYGVTIHSLRHSFAYLLKQQGVHVTTAQRLLGHSDPRVTLAIYTQVLDSEIDAVGKLINSLILK